MHVTRKHTVLRYDGTNSAYLLDRLGDHQFVSEADGVLTVVPLLGGLPVPITAEYMIVEGWPYSPAEVERHFYIVPEPEPTP